ncbi:hypothetical protein BTVI_28688 [Pitangus sulphuratus]|nr:hypothetical protein BTVI_28688 [Pitangus sulphuratus]
MQKLELSLVCALSMARTGSWKKAAKFIQEGIASGDRVHQCRYGNWEEKMKESILADGVDTVLDIWHKKQNPLNDD